MSTTSTPVESTPRPKLSLSGGDVTRLSMPRATRRPPFLRTRVPYARPISSKTSGVMSMPTLPRTSYARKMNGLIVTAAGSRRRLSHDGDRFDLDHPIGVGERGHAHERRGRSLLAEEFLAHRNEVSAAANVSEIRVDLDDAL